MCCASLYILCMWHCQCLLAFCRRNSITICPGLQARRIVNGFTSLYTNCDKEVCHFAYLDRAWKGDFFKGTLQKVFHNEIVCECPLIIWAKKCHKQVFQGGVAVVWFYDTFQARLNKICSVLYIVFCFCVWSTAITKPRSQFVFFIAWFANV